jgi:hypothetical protein
MFFSVLFSVTLSVYILPKCERTRFKTVKTTGTIIFLYIPWRHMGSVGTSPSFLTSTLVRWVVGFTTRTLYSLGKSPQCPLNGTQNQYDRFRDEKNSLLVPGIEPRPSSPQPFAILTDTSTVSSVFGGCRKSDKQFIYYVKIHSDVPQ